MEIEGFAQIDSFSNAYNNPTARVMTLVTKSGPNFDSQHTWWFVINSSACTQHTDIHTGKTPKKLPTTNLILHCENWRG